MTDLIELLAPARDLECGRAAIDCGADAIYIGAQSFGARERAGNSLDDIKALVSYAHRYWAKVYVTVNTLLHNSELPKAVDLIHKLDAIGVDAVIIQDMGLLECNLPPIPLIASTQTHNHTPAKVAFLEQVGMQRVILARELSLPQIKAIRAKSNVELESFVHGALCVSYSGQCYMSYAIGGRSGNRGTCAQPCRRLYTLIDSDGTPLVKDRYLLSLHDLNLSDSLGELLDAGISSFKIEGRLKDKTYIINVVSYYRQQLDAILKARGLRKSSSGESHIDFKPDPDKTFNRGYTSHFLHGRKASPGSIETPKMMGERLGEVIKVERQTIVLNGAVEVHNGDGICFFDEQHVLRGTVVNTAQGASIKPDRLEGIHVGSVIYRNHDHAFLNRLKKQQLRRKIGVQLTLKESATGLQLQAVDADNNQAVSILEGEKIVAEKPEQALETARKQLQKTGGTDFTCVSLEIVWQQPYFVSHAALNDLRRRVLAALSVAREQNRPRLRWELKKNDVPYPEETLSYRGNVLNQNAADFYRRHGVKQIEPAAESGVDMYGKRVMTSKYCIQHHLGHCPRENPQATPLKSPLYLVDEDGYRFEVRFDCAACEMHIVF